MMYSSWDIRHNRVFCHFGPFCPMALLTTWKIRVLKKWKKPLKILQFYTSIPQMMIIWCMVPECNRIFCHFGLFFGFLPLPHPPLPNNPENQNFEKMKKITVDIIILYICTINENLWCMVLEIWSATEFFILDLFLPFYPLTTQKIKILK